MPLSTTTSPPPTRNPYTASRTGEVDYDFDGDANVVETYISYLRKKLDALGPPLIQTVRGVGYRLHADV